MVELKACAIEVEKFDEKVEIKNELYKYGTDTEVKAEDISTTTVQVGK
jgi:formate dehydrogenase major subunit